MPSHLSSPWNNAVSYLEMYFRDQKLFNGSCFFWDKAGRTHLITNWHNLSGRSPRTGEPLSRTAGIPDRVRFMAYRRTSEPDASGRYMVSYDPVEIPLCDDDFSHPRWREHPGFGHRVDIATLDVTDMARGLDLRNANQVEADAVLDPTTAQDVFVVGFPFGLIPGAPAPVWKRGSIAMDPTFDIEGLPKMLIDTATRPGMSGSVVVARHVIVTQQVPKKDGTLSEMLLYAEAQTVVGIYSGRHYPDLERAQLGIVWKRSAIEEVAEHGEAPSGLR